MKASTALRILVITTAVISSCYEQSIPVQAPTKVSPKSCAASNGPRPSLFNLEKASSTQPFTRSLGGGTVQSKDFTIELLLYCDPTFQVDAIDAKYHSDVGELAIYSNWRFDALVQNEKTFSYFGLEPDIQLRLVSYTQGYIAQGQLQGIAFAPHAIPDFSKKSSLRFVYIVEGPFGQFAGAALSFDVEQVADGLRPENIVITALSDTELQSMKSGFPTVVP